MNAGSYTRLYECYANWIKNTAQGQFAYTVVVVKRKDMPKEKRVELLKVFQQYVDEVVTEDEKFWFQSILDNEI